MAATWGPPTFESPNVRDRERVSQHQLSPLSTDQCEVQEAGFCPLESKALKIAVTNATLA